jgi:hypothetical protein
MMAPRKQTKKSANGEGVVYRRNDPALGGRLTRRDRVAGGFDDLLHDSVIAELKVERNKAITVPDCAKFLASRFSTASVAAANYPSWWSSTTQKNKPRPESLKTMWDGCNRPCTAVPIPDIRRWSSC